MTRPPPYSADDDAAILYLRRVEHLTWPQIAYMLGRASGMAVSWRYRKLRARQELAKAPPKVFRTRPCMRCGVNFASEGPHNRMCDPCRTFADGLSPFACASATVRLPAPGEADES